jgi:hypothetical protein
MLLAQSENFMKCVKEKKNLNKFGFPIKFCFVFNIEAPA